MTLKILDYTKLGINRDTQLLITSLKNDMIKTVTTDEHTIFIKNYSLTYWLHQIPNVFNDEILVVRVREA